MALASLHPAAQVAVVVMVGLVVLSLIARVRR